MGSTKITMHDLIDKHFVVSEAKTGKVFGCRLCGTNLRSVKTVSQHWRTKHQHETNIAVE